MTPKDVEKIRKLINGTSDRNFDEARLLSLFDDMVYYYMKPEQFEVFDQHGGDTYILKYYLQGPQGDPGWYYCLEEDYPGNLKGPYSTKQEAIASAKRANMMSSLTLYQDLEAADD
jgi:hypothetical protein